MINSILFRAEGGDIAGFLTLISENGLTVQKFCKSDGLCFGYLPPEEYRTAARLARSVGVRLQILEKNGVSFALRRYRRRMGLFVWPAVFTIALLFSQNFLWAVDVTGCETLQPQVIRTEAEEYGLRTGLYLPKADLAGIAVKLRKDFPQIASVSLNRIGSRVEINLTETVSAPEVLPDDPCSIFAARTGKLVSLSVAAGQAAVSPGQTVAEGQLLISGVGETADGKTFFSHASGEAMAEALIDEEFSLSLNQSERTFTGEEARRYSLDLFGRELPLSLPDSIKERFSLQSGLYETENSLEPLTLFGIELPLGLVTETRRFYTESERTFTEEEALALLQQAAADFEKTDLSGTEILSKEESAAVKDGVMTLRVRWTCLCDIAEKRPVGISE